MLFMALSLIALGYGFKVFIEASELKNDRRRSFGRIVGIYIMAVAFAASVGVVGRWAKTNCAVGKSSIMGKFCGMQR